MTILTNPTRATQISAFANVSAFSLYPIWFAQAIGKILVTKWVQNAIAIKFTFETEMTGWAC